MEQSEAAVEAPVYSSEIEMDSQKGRRRLDSMPKDYYLTIDEMVRGDTEEVNRHLNKMNKDSIICLLPEAISQMRIDRERDIRTKELVLEVKNVIRDSFIENNDQVPSQELVNGVKPAVEQAVTNCRVENTGGTPFAAPVPAPLRQPMESHQHQIRINGIPESDSKNRTEVLNYQSEEFNKVMKFLGEDPTITDMKRLGRPSPDNNRPRTLLITFHKSWDVRKVWKTDFILQAISSTIILHFSNRDFFLHFYPPIL